jgi:hypothetical protein
MASIAWNWGTKTNTIVVIQFMRTTTPPCSRLSQLLGHWTFYSGISLVIPKSNDFLTHDNKILQYMNMVSIWFTLFLFQFKEINNTKRTLESNAASFSVLMCVYSPNVHTPLDWRPSWLWWYGSWPPQYNWDIVKSGAKHHKPSQTTIGSACKWITQHTATCWYFVD